MELILNQKNRYWVSFFCRSLLGSLLIYLGTLVKIPTLPVPTTLQTFAVIILALIEGPQIALSSALLYLGGASLGLPVLSSLSNPLWFMGTTGGYLMAFPIAGYLIGKMTEKRRTVGWLALSIFCGQLVIYSAGCLVLQCSVGFKAAFVGGGLFFIPGAIVKMIGAVALVRWKERQ